MSGRGRGRRGSGAGAERAATNRGPLEPLLLSVQQPSALFPVMERKPLPLACGEEAEYLLALKQEFRGAMKTRPGFLQPHAGHRSHADVERYSDKYLNSSEQTDALSDWITDWKRFPKEIRLCLRRTRKKGAPTAAPATAQADQGKKEGKDALVKLETLATEGQRSSDEEEEEEKKKEEDDQEADEEYDEEELEEVSACTHANTKMFYFERSPCVCGRRRITSCPTSTTAKTLAPKATTTWTKPFTETFVLLPWRHSDQTTV
ncbi:uncharacterized protein LOC144058494 isoform X3 [Vanacampus margaritifer]